MNEILIVDAIHVVTFCWAISRLFVEEGWKLNIIDGIATLVAMGSWFAMTTYSIQANAFNEVGKAPLITLSLFVLFGVVYVILVFIFAFIRMKLYDMEEENE